MRTNHLVFKALDAQTRQIQQQAGVDYTTAWYTALHNPSRHGQSQEVQSEPPAEDIYSLPLGKVDTLRLEPLLRDSRIEEAAPVMNCAAAFASLETPPPWDGLAAFLAQLSTLVYGDPLEVKCLLSQHNAMDIKWFTSGSVEAMGCVIQGSPVIAFKGTDSLRLAGLDLLCVPSGWPIRHAGFRRAWRLLRDQVVEWFTQLSTCRGLVVTGHSLGGAMAFNCAYEMAGYGVDAVITFGAPRPGMYGFKKAYNTQHCGSDRNGKSISLFQVTQRYSHETDAVSRVPPPLLYHHVGGVERMLREDGTFVANRPPYFLERAEKILTQFFGYGSLFDSELDYRGVVNAIIQLLSLFFRLVGIGLWALFFLVGYLVIIAFPLVLIDLWNHSVSGYSRSFARSYPFIEQFAMGAERARQNEKNPGKAKS